MEYVDQLLTKKSLRDIIGNVLKECGVPRTVEFLDNIKELGYTMAFKGGLSFNLGDVIVPEEKSLLLNRSEEHTSELQSLVNLVCRLLLEIRKAHV